MLDYSEYKSLVDILDKSELDETYKELINKEDKVLDTVNAVVNHYKDKKAERKMFLHMSLNEIYKMFFLEWPGLWMDLTRVKTTKDVADAFLKNNRVIYLGIVCVVVALILFFVDTSK